MTNYLKSLKEAPDAPIHVHVPIHELAHAVNLPHAMVAHIQPAHTQLELERVVNLAHAVVAALPPALVVVAALLARIRKLALVRELVHQL